METSTLLTLIHENLIKLNSINPRKKIEPIKELENIESFVIQESEFKGVGVLLPKGHEHEIFRGKFTSSELRIINIGDEFYLGLLTKNKIDNTMVNQFVYFLRYVDDYNLEEAYTAPYRLYENFAKTYGNKFTEINIFPLFAELYVWRELLDASFSDFTWVGFENKPKDIVSELIDIEVKSSNSAYSKEVTIHGFEQMLPNDGKKLYISHINYCEDIGITFSQFLNEFELKYPTEYKIVHQYLYEKDILSNTYLLEKSIKVYNLKFYLIDEAFPVITRESFKGDEIPKGIKRINYVVSLDNLQYTELKSL